MADKPRGYTQPTERPRGYGQAGIGAQFDGAFCVDTDPPPAPIFIGPYRFWIDENGGIRVKNGDPSNSTDGSGTSGVDSVTINALPAASVANLTDELPGNQSGTTRKITGELLAGLVQAQRALDGFKIPLDKAGNHLPDITIAGATEFTVDDAPAAVNGGSCMVRVIANGTNTPTFTGMTRLGSTNWVNTNTTVNVIQFIRVGGVVYYSVAQHGA